MALHFFGIGQGADAHVDFAWQNCGTVLVVRAALDFPDVEGDATFVVGERLNRHHLLGDLEDGAAPLLMAAARMRGPALRLKQVIANAFAASDELAASRAGSTTSTYLAVSAARSMSSRDVWTADFLIGSVNEAQRQWRGSAGTMQLSGMLQMRDRRRPSCRRYRGRTRCRPRPGRAKP